MKSHFAASLCSWSTCSTCCKKSSIESKRESQDSPRSKETPRIFSFLVVFVVFFCWLSMVFRWFSMVFWWFLLAHESQTCTPLQRRARARLDGRGFHDVRNMLRMGNTWKLYWPLFEIYTNPTQGPLPPTYTGNLCVRMSHKVVVQVLSTSAAIWSFNKAFLSTLSQSPKGDLGWLNITRGPDQTQKTFASRSSIGQNPLLRKWTSEENPFKQVKPPGDNPPKKAVSTHCHLLKRVPARQNPLLVHGIEGLMSSIYQSRLGNNICTWPIENMWFCWVAKDHKINNWWNTTKSVIKIAKKKTLLSTKGGPTPYFWRWKRLKKDCLID